MHQINSFNYKRNIKIIYLQTYTGSCLKNLNHNDIIILNAALIISTARCLDIKYFTHCETAFQNLNCQI